MQPFQWEIEGKQTAPLTHLGNTYQMKLEGTIVRLFENGAMILEEDIGEEALQNHRDDSLPFEQQLLQWGQLVLDTFFQKCGVCEKEKMAFPIHLTPTPPEEAYLYKSKGVEIICPQCVETLKQQSREKSLQLKNGFLRGEGQIFGGTDEELMELLGSPNGAMIRHFTQTFYPDYKLGALRFSDSRLYLAIILLKDEEIESFLILAQDKHGIITTLPPDIGLESLGFQEGDEIQFLTIG